jgi:hypothetical protein
MMMFCIDRGEKSMTRETREFVRAIAKRMREESKGKNLTAKKAERIFADFIADESKLKRKSAKRSVSKGASIT